MDSRTPDDRRKDPEDRRNIPRFTDGELISQMRTETKLLKVLMGGSIAFAIFEMVWSLRGELEWGTRGIFFLVAFTFLTVLSFRRLQMIQLYIENNSINNLRRSQESLNVLLTYLAIILVITFIVSLFYRL